MSYELLLTIGVLGVLVMGLSGLRGGRSGRGKIKSKIRVARSKAKSKIGMDGSVVLDAMAGFLSPLALFSVCLGAGAVGIVIKLWWAALLGGLLFWLLIIDPLQNALLRFASEPAKNLDGVCATEAVVQSRFDANRQGMVTITIDGQHRRVLATLAEGNPSEIVMNEKLVVVTVDTKRNTCSVVRL
jgi:hypothetical protein